MARTTSAKDGFSCVQIALQHESDLALGLRLEERACRYRIAIGDLHIGEQHAVIWLVDIGVFLDDFRRKTDLAARQPPSFCQPAHRIGFLDTIGSSQIARRQMLTDRRTSLLCSISIVYIARRLFNTMAATGNCGQILVFHASTLPNPTSRREYEM